jgi:hypothetical protein
MSESVIPAEEPSHMEGPDRMTEAPVATLVLEPIPPTETPPTAVLVEPPSALPTEIQSPKTEPTEGTNDRVDATTTESETAAPATSDRVAPPEALDGAAPATTTVLVEPPREQAPVATIVANADGPVPQMEALEYRVQRLESTVAALQDTRSLEDRVSERIANRLSRKSGKTMREKASVIIDVGRRLLPLSSEKPEPPPPPNDGPAASAPHASEPQPMWLLFEIYSEGLAILRMFVDPHYRMPWRSRLLPLLLFIGIMTSSMLFPVFLEKLPGGALIISVLDKIVDLILAFFLFKILGREAKRYQQTFPSLADKNRS